jgi:hypothetical protein
MRAAGQEISPSGNLGDLDTNYLNFPRNVRFTVTCDGADEFTKAARLLKLDDERARIERAVRHASFESLAGQERTEGFAEASDKARRFFRDGRAGQWRTELTMEQSARVLARHGAQMQRFGYAAAR